MACDTSQQKLHKDIGDVIIANVESNYGSFIRADTLGDGTLFYSITLKGDELLKNEKEIIGFIDKTLEKVPDKIVEGKMGHGADYTYNSYDWNTPQIKLSVQSSFYFNEKQDSVYLRFWMNKK